MSPSTLEWSLISPMHYMDAMYRLFEVGHHMAYFSATKYALYINSIMIL